jgi:hypothetical protein
MKHKTTHGIKQLMLFLLFFLPGAWAVNAANVVWVTSLDDEGQGTLREAMTVYGKTQPGDTIRFAPFAWGANRTITLSTDINIIKSLVIDGENNNIILSGPNGVFGCNYSNTNLSISNLTVSDYNTNEATSAAIYWGGSNGTLTLTNVRFLNNVGGSRGSAISAVNNVIIDNCYFSGNRHERASTSSNYGGGAIGATTAVVVVRNSIFENNSTNCAGGAIFAQFLTVTGSVFKNNTAGSYGGAICIRNSGTPEVNLLGNTFIGNSASSTTEGGGALGTLRNQGNAWLAANVFQDNKSAKGDAYNEFHSGATSAKLSIESNGYNVFKGTAVPASAADVWTGAATDTFYVDDLVDAVSYRPYPGTAAINLIPSGVSSELITGVDWPEFDIHGHPTAYGAAAQHAGASQWAIKALLDITAEDPESYPHESEKHIGTSLVGLSPLSLEDIGFILPAEREFTAGSAALVNGSAFTLNSVSVRDGDNGPSTRLLVTVEFEPTAEQEYTDTLIISADGAHDYRIPLRGAGVSWLASPVELQDFGSLAVGDSSEIRTITVTRSSISGAFTWSLKKEQSAVFPVSEAEFSAATGGRLGVRFVPETAGAVYADTLILRSEGSEIVHEIALAGAALPVAVASGLSFGEVVASADSTLSLPVTIAPDYGVTVSAIESSSPTFSVAKSAGWSDTGGGELLVTFAPSEAGDYQATLTLSGENFAPIAVSLEGVGLARPVISSDSALYRFGRVVQSQTQVGEKITVTLAHPQSSLSADGVFTLAGTSEGIFAIVSVSAEEDDAAEVILSFTPSAAVEYLDTLVIRADYAEEYRIPLSGEGYQPSVASEPALLDFGTVEVGESPAEAVTVTVTDPAAPLTSSAFTLAGTSEGIFDFEIASISAAFDVAEVTVSFSPSAAVDYVDTLIVLADYAREYRVPLRGTGTDPAGISGVSGLQPSVSVRQGDIVVSHVSLGSVVSVYNLHGRLVKTQRVTSDVETLKTSGLPHSVYVVVVRDSREAQRRKIVL